MTALLNDGRARNRYLLTRSGFSLATRTLPALLMVAGFVGAPLLAALGATLGAALGLAVITVVSILLGLGGFIGTVVAMWVFLLSGQRDVARATEMWRAGDSHGPIPLCQRPLARVFRADVRMRAFYTLGLCAESNADFAEAEELFQHAYASAPAIAGAKWKRHAQCMMLAHRAIALVATGRIAEADAIVLQAARLFPPVAVGVLDAITDDAAFGPVGVTAALREIEPGRDPRALLSLATVVVLAARGMARESLELVDRERYTLMAGLSSREKSLLANVEARGRGLLGSGPLRTPGAAAAGDPREAAWADRVLAVVS